MTGVKDRVALVTGAGSADGIGYATARLLCAAGAKVAITSTTKRIFKRLDELGGAVRTFAKPADLTDDTAVKSLIEDIARDLGPIDILINNAGMVQVGRDVDLSRFSSGYLIAILAIKETRHGIKTRNGISTGSSSSCTDEWA